MSSIIIRQQGQALTEFIILMPLFFLILFGIFEVTYLYRAKATLNTATFEAVRAGSLDHAQLAPMRNALVQGMLAQYVKGDVNPASLIRGIAVANLVESEMNQFTNSITIVSPTKDIFNHFKTSRMLKLKGQANEGLHIILPNDNLNLRSTATKDITIDGSNQKINIQDSNILKIKSYWCYDMKVPIIKDLIHGVISGGWLVGQASTEQQACNRLGIINGIFTDNPKYIAISSQAIIRMQTPIILSGNNLQ